MTIHPLKTTSPIRTTTNKDVRVREYLTADEIDQLIAALRKKIPQPEPRCFAGHNYVPPWPSRWRSRAPQMGPSRL